ncbi:hypothetical protein LSGJ_01389 [Ligilactobacillus salivarius GJ-24]|uniref:DUF6883 domain-containing protein n=1 Tax=Ligilactobacillus salivarius GJ-24 TaxID=1041521 RepID=F7QW40_9LACO|nr:DUF6883 domain-containing protein [Ligilactobacillus salivarius]EGM50841.1 hypothetical protein LSGJ_01389 [Ligilactobacillus salivarius GJ-24]
MITVKEEKQRIDYLLKRDNVTDEELEKIYNEGVNQLRAIVDKSFNTYAVDGVLVPNNLARKVTKKDMVLLKEQYDKLPDDLELPEKQRLDYYLAISQMSLGKLITATLGTALIGITHKVAKVIRQNNKTAVDEEYYYQKKNLQSPKKSKINPIAKDNYVFSKQDNNFVSWTERLWLDHDQILNRIDNSLNSMLRQGMRAQDIAEKLFPGNAKSMRNDNIPKTLIDATVSAKRLARTEAAAREDELTDIFFKENKIKYFDWVTEPGACKKCLVIGALGPYKVDDEASPRIPGSSHPNCRCRRVPAEVIDDYDKIDLIKKALAAGAISSTIKRDEENTRDANEEDKNIPVDDNYYKYKEILGSDMPSKENYNRLVEEGGKYLDNLVVDYMRRLRLKEHPELKLPNLDNMVFPEPKFTKYLFSPKSEKGWAKGLILKEKLGYSIDNYKEYIQELKRLAPLYPAKEKEDAGYGAKYEQQFMMYNDYGEPINIKVGWIVPKENLDAIRYTSSYIKEVNSSERKNSARI